MRCRDDYGDTVHIVVEKSGSKRTFAVYEGLLKHYSTYFANALKAEWRPQDGKPIVLPDTNPEIFRAFFHWLSTGRPYAKLTDEGKIPLTTNRICDIYIFGDMRGIPELCNAAVNLLFQKNMQDWIYDIYILPIIYDNTAENAAIRRFMVDWGYEKHGFTNLKARSHVLPKKYLIDFVQKLSEGNMHRSKAQDMSYQQYVKWKKPHLCDTYHDHGLTKEGG